MHAFAFDLFPHIGLLVCWLDICRHLSLQAFDPYALPPGAVIKFEHLQALTARERSMYVPASVRDMALQGEISGE